MGEIINDKNNETIKVDIRTTEDEITEKENEDHEWDIDGLLKETGPCGTFHWLLQVLVAVLVISVAHFQINVYFLGDNPPWKCISNTTNLFCRENYRKLIPSDDKNFYKRCEMNRTDWAYAVHKKYSFVTEFNLVCDRTWMAAITIGAFYIGGVGTIPAGILADKYGRKIVMTVTAIIILTTSICCSLVANHWQLLVLRIVLGGAVMSCYSNGFVYLSEIVAPSYRIASSAVYQTLYFCLSCLLMTAFAYFKREWRSLQLYVSFLCILPAIILFVFPNSPRWLLQNGKTDDAIKVLRRMAKYNQKSLADDIKLRSCEENSKQHRYSFIDLFREKQACYLNLLLGYNFFTVSLLYFAIALQSSNLGGNMYQAFALTSLADSPAFFACWYGCNRFGRKKTVLIPIVVAGLCLGGCTLVPSTYKSKYVINITVSIIAKFLTNLSFVSMFTWAVELYPTVIRAQGFSYCMAVERVGASAAPFLINLLRQMDLKLPYIIMMVMSALCGFTGFVLPETLGMKTKETFEDFFDDFSESKNKEKIDDIDMSFAQGRI